MWMRLNTNIVDVGWSTKIENLRCVALFVDAGHLPGWWRIGFSGAQSWKKSETEELEVNDMLTGWFRGTYGVVEPSPM
jgi:hypothetical protein